MNHFTRRLSTPDGALNFYFNRFFASDGVRWHVSTVDRSRRAIVVHLSFDLRDGTWKIVDDPAVPLWLLEMQEQFSLLIEQNEEI